MVGRYYCSRLRGSWVQVPAASGEAEGKTCTCTQLVTNKGSKNHVLYYESREAMDWAGFVRNSLDLYT